MKRDALIKILMKFPENTEFSQFTADPQSLKYIHDFVPISYKDMLYRENCEREMKTLHDKNGKYAIWSENGKFFVRIPDTNKHFRFRDKKTCAKVVKMLSKVVGMEDFGLIVKEYKS